MGFFDWLKDSVTVPPQERRVPVRITTSPSTTATPQERARENKAVALGLDRDASWNEIHDAEYQIKRDEIRRQCALRKGLHEEAFWYEIGLHGERKARTSLGQKYGLSKTCPTWEEIHAAETRDNARKEMAISLGLPEDSPWENLGEPIAS